MKGKENVGGRRDGSDAHGEIMLDAGRYTRHELVQVSDDRLRET